MNKVLFLLVFFSICNYCFAGDGEVVEVPMTADPMPSRGNYSMPIVEFCAANSAMTIAFESANSYVLEVEDANGVTWYSGPLNTSGVPMVYYLNLQSPNTYYITISSANDSFYGILEL